MLFNVIFVQHAAEKGGGVGPEKVLFIARQERSANVKKRRRGASPVVPFGVLVRTEASADRRTGWLGD
jgi:hypothetical protein